MRYKHIVSLARATKPYRRFTSRELSLIIISSALGAVVSVPISHADDFLNAIPGILFGSQQIMSGIHVLWLVLASILVRKKGLQRRKIAWRGWFKRVIKGDEVLSWMGWKPINLDISLHHTRPT